MNIGQLLTSEQDALTDLVTQACNGEYIEPHLISKRIEMIKAIKLWLEVIPHPEYSIEKFCDEADIWGLEQNTLIGEHDTEALQELAEMHNALTLIESEHLLPF